MTIYDIIERVKGLAYNIIYTPKKEQVVISVHKNLVGEVTRQLNEYQLDIRYPRRGVIAAVIVKLR